MSMTAYPNGVSSFGIPLPSGMIPPISGTYYHVCQGDSSIVNTQGNQIVGSSGNSGLDPQHALDSIATAYGKCRDGAGDGIIIWSYGTTTAATTSYLTTPLLWTKTGITMVGICAPTFMAQRVRIANLNASTPLASVITVSGNNNTFLNMAMLNVGSDATSLNALTVTGQRNYFGNVNAYLADPTAGALTGSSNLTCSGGLENTFERCVFGTDTVNRVATNAHCDVLLTGQTGRLYFKDCIFLSMGTSGQAAHGAIKIGGAGDGITRNCYFDDCKFVYYNDGAVSAQTSLIIGTLPNNGKLLLSNPSIIGYAAIDSVGAATAYTNTAASAATGGIVTGG